MISVSSFRRIWSSQLRIRRDRRWQSGAIVFCILAELFCFAGYLGGYFDKVPGGPTRWHDYQWDAGTIAYTVAFWLVWIGGLFVAGKYEKAHWAWRARIMVSLPVVLFLFFALGLVKLGPH